MKSLHADFFRSEKFYLLAIAFVAVLLMLPILFFGLPRGYDMPHHYQCALTFYDALVRGDFYPSWTLDRNFGYGSVELRLYPPISHYVLALFYFITGNWHWASWLTFTFWAILGSFGVYLWSREYLTSRDAAIAAVLYLLMPYNLHRAYLIFLYSEYAAGAILPFCFAFAARLARRNESQNDKRKIWLDVFGLTISVAAIILTHLPSTVIGLSALALYVLLIARRDFYFCRRYFARLSMAVLLALAATSFFWIKVVQERYLMAKNAVYDEVQLHYQYNFLFTPIQSYDQPGEVVYKGVTMFVDLVLLATFAFLVIGVIRFWKKNATVNANLWRGLWATFAVTLFLCLILSKPLWDALPLLQEVQFPWRWLTIVSLCVPVLAAGGIETCLKWFADKSKRPFALVAVGLLLFGLTFTIKQIVNQALYVPISGVPSFIEQARSDKGFTFWWTIWARKETFDVRDEVLAGNRAPQIQNWTATEREFQIAPGEKVEARVAVFYYPNWQVTVNGIPVETRADANGALLFALPSENAQVKISFQETFAVTMAKWISGLAWLGLMLFLFSQLRTKKIFAFNRHVYQKPQSVSTG